MVNISCCHANWVGAEKWLGMPPFLMGDLTALDYEGEGQREGLREEQRVLL